MGRSLRSNIVSFYNHIYIRGVNKSDIFRSAKDFHVFIKILHKAHDYCDFKLNAYCLMSNHYHLLLHVNNPTEVSKVMHYINYQYAKYFNTEYDRTGPLFENRFNSKPVLDSDYYQQLIFYIHQNPVKAKLVLEAIEWFWSSAASYYGLREPETFLNHTLKFNSTDYKNIDYADFEKHKIALKNDWMPDLVENALKDDINKVKHDILEEIYNKLAHKNHEKLFVYFLRTELKLSFKNIAKITNLSKNNVQRNFYLSEKKFHVYLQQSKFWYEQLTQKKEFLVKALLI